MKKRCHLTFTAIRRYALSILLTGAVTAACGQSAMNARDLSIIRSVDPADTAYADLAGFRKAVGNARIVMLGEQTHGEATTFEAKTRLIKFLYEKMGFEVLAFESGLYDCARIWENTRNGGNLADEVTGSLFFMYATSKQMMPLFQYIQAKVKSPRPLTVAGFESQHSGRNAIRLLFPDFETFLRKDHAAVLDSNWNLFKRIAVATFNSRAYRPEDAERALFFQKLEELKKLLAAKTTPDDGHISSSPGFWYQVTTSIESQASRYWELVKGNELSVRDLQMAQNLIWLADKAFPGKKIIVWAHNIHIAKNTGALLAPLTGTPIPFFESLTPMGTTVKAHFGKDAYILGFSGAQGTYVDYNDNKIKTVPAPAAGSIESSLSATGHPYIFVDYKQAGKYFRDPQVASLFDFTYLKSGWPGILDGLFFINTSTPVERTTL
ncbi:erythromycin esterase family protein [Chitinophaga sp. Mgbs1]|uniref:Erythromycin esterase family protein n=1 Tax=Chitinophaga solisilvae TaxID=1233460 RepID=A0A3S1AXW6_9BACT|nr:erythromycin esterase family protein [Chitinophaga solisilvae]